MRLPLFACFEEIGEPFHSSDLRFLPTPADIMNSLFDDGRRSTCCWVDIMRWLEQLATDHPCLTSFLILAVAFYIMKCIIELCLRLIKHLYQLVDDTIYPDDICCSTCQTNEVEHLKMMKKVKAKRTSKSKNSAGVAPRAKSDQFFDSYHDREANRWLVVGAFFTISTAVLFSLRSSQ